MGRDEIRDFALGMEMGGLDGWTYPYQKVLIDEHQGEVIGLWKQVADAKRPDGSAYEVAGLGGSWFRYAGNWQWSWQRDFFDFGNATALFVEMMRARRPVRRNAAETRPRQLRQAIARPLRRRLVTRRPVGMIPVVERHCEPGGNRHCGNEPRQLVAHPYHDVAIVGIHNTTQALELEGHDAESIALEGAIGALADAGIAPVRG